jgi:hypothetical protein
LKLILFSRLSPYVDEIIRDRHCGFDVTDQILEKKWEYSDEEHQLFVNFMKAYYSIWREVLYNVLIEFWVLKKLVRPVKMCLNETYSKFRIGKYLSGTFAIQNGLK